jgi:Ca2+-binding RTX toxin-like protein
MTTVTVPGAQGTIISENFVSQANLGVANLIAAALAAAQTAGTLTVEDYATATSISGGIGELAVTTAGGANVTVPAGYQYVAIDSVVGGAVTISGGGVSIFAGNQNITYFGAASSTLQNIALGDGNDFLSLPSGSTYSVGLGNGNDTVYANGSGTVVGGFGSNLLLADGGSNLIVSQGINDTVVAGAGSDTVQLTATDDPVVFGGSGTTTILDGSNVAATVVGGSGSMAYVGGSFSTSPTIFGGTGTATLFGGSGQDLNYFDGSNTVSGVNYLAAGSGDETLNAGGASFGVGEAVGSGDDVLVGTLGNDTFFGGSGAATITGHGGSDLYVFGAEGVNAGHAGGTTLIQDWNSNDLFVVVGYGEDAAQTAINSATVSGGSTTVELSDNTKITFANITDTTQIHNVSFT